MFERFVDCQKFVCQDQCLRRFRIERPSLASLVPPVVTAAASAEAWVVVVVVVASTLDTVVSLAEAPRVVLAVVASSTSPTFVPPLTPLTP